MNQSKSINLQIPSVMNAPEQCKVTVMQSDVFAEPKVSEIEHPRPKDDLNKYFFKTATGLAYEADAVRKHILNGKSLLLIFALCDKIVYFKQYLYHIHKSEGHRVGVPWRFEHSNPIFF